MRRTLASWRPLVSPAALLLLLAAMLGGYVIASRGAATFTHTSVTLTEISPDVPQNALLAVIIERCSAFFICSSDDV